MPNKSFTTGPGTFIVGEVASEQEWSAQVKSIVVEWDVDSEDDEFVLSGETIPAEDVYTAVVSGECFQDISETGMTSYSWEHKGEVLPFTFVPNTVEDRQVTGEVKVRPIAVGGDVKAKAISDFEFPCVGEPAIGDVA
jgi:hypothetical protein